MFGLLLVLTILPSMGGLTFGSHTPGNIAGILGGFEIDGDYDFDGSAIGSGTTATVATRDWANVGTVTMSPDTFGQAEDSSFKEGSKEREPDNWVIEAHNVPGKDDLTRAYVAADITVVGQFLFLSFERMNVEGQGDVHVNFELNKSPDSIVNKEGTTIPQRSDGDLLVVYDYAGGSNAVNIELRSWDGIADDPGTAQNEEALFGSWNLLSNVDAVGDVNFDGALTRPAGTPFGGGIVDTLRFGEAALDLSGIPGFLSCPGFSQFYAKSRASGESFDSALKDVTTPTPVDFSTCGSIKVLKKDDSNNPLNGAVFELYNDVNNDNALDAGDTLEQTCTTGEEATAGQCTFEDIAPGEYVVQEVSAPLGYVLDPTVSAVTVRIREAVTVAHTYVDPKIRYRLTLTPPDDVNLVNNNHIFTSHLEKSLDSGATWVDAGSETVGLALAGQGSITTIAPAGPSTGTCTTTLAGTCSITIRSSNPGDSTLTATFNKQTATAPVALSQTAAKHWVNYRISIGPEATNLVGTTHTFTALLERTTDGAVWAPVVGAAVAGTIVTGPGSITGGTCVSGTTSAAGSCTITVTSQTPGDTTVRAAYSAVVGDTSGTFSATAVKHWVNYQITVAPDGVNLVGQAHTFTVTLRRSAGNGFQAVQGAHIDLGWVGVAGSSITGGTCVLGTTAANGTCTVIVNSSAAGGGTLTATYNTVLDSGPASFSDSGTKSWVGYLISVTPDQDTNLLPVEPTHTFNVRLSSTDASLGPVGGKLIDLTLTSTVATITSVGSGGSIDPGGLGGTCLTNSSGECTVVITTTGPGTATLTASYLASVAGATLTIGPDSGDKTWITYRITVTPEQATNLVGQPHTFTVKIESTDDGSVWDPVVGATPTLGLTGVGSITGGTCVGSVTNGSGECTAIVSSAGTGVATLTAQYLATVGTASHTFSDSGTKTWINYQILVTPLEAANLVSTDHVFTVTTFKDSGDGNGFQPLAGVNPTLTLGGVGQIGSTTCDDPGGTSAAGQCTVTVTSAAAGLTTLTASFLGTADGASATFISGPATKQWVDYRLTVTPETAVNAVGTTHTFTVTLQTDTGSGFGPAGSQTVELALSGLGTITQIPGGAIAPDSRSGSCTTSSSGQCTVTITSATAGESRLTATFGAIVGSTSRTFSDFGDKLWVSISVSVAKTNDANRDGTFTDSEVAPVAGSAVDFLAIITNTSDQTIVLAAITDFWPGQLEFAICQTLVGTQLTPGQFVSCAFTVPGYAPSAGSSLTNTVVVLAYRLGDSGQTTRAQDTSRVASPLPAALTLLVEKTNDANADGTFSDTETAPTEGATVTFRAVITNNSAVTLVIDSIVDSWPGQVPFGVCSELIGAELAPGVSVTCTFTVLNYSPLASVGAGLTDTVAVLGHEKVNPSNQVSGSDTSVVKSTRVLGEKVVKPQVLPATGSNSSSPALLAVVLIALGSALNLASRRRRRHCFSDGPRLRL